MLPTWILSHQRQLREGASRQPIDRENNPPAHRSLSGNAPRGNESRQASRPQGAARAMVRGSGQRPRNGTTLNSFPIRQSGPPTRIQPAAVILPERSSLKSTTILIKGLPARTTIWDIRQFFGQYGNVVFVELSDSSRGNARTSKVRFEPPPRDTSFFQQGFCSFRIGNTMFRVSIEFSGPSSEDDTLQTPLGNPCPSSLSFLPKKLTFGVLTQPTEFMPKKAIEPVNFGHGLKLTADFRRKKLAIYFPLRVEYELQQYRIEIRFGNIKTIHRAGIDGDLTALVIVVHDPPLVWNKQLDVEGEGWTDRLFWAEEELWHRSVEVRAASAPLRTEPVSIQEQENVINFGRWTTYWVDLDKTSQEQWSVIETHLRDWNIKTKLDVNFTQIANKDPELWAILAEPPTTLSTGTSSSWSEDLALLDRTTYISLPFDVRYQLEVCISRGILSEFNIERKFLEKLLELATHDSSNSSRARLVLEYAADRGEHIYNPMALFEDQAALTYYPTTLHIPDYCALVRKVTVTPTRVYFNTPTVETTNRVVRHYKHVQEFFLRVQFTDELLKGRVRAHDTERYDEVFTRVYRVLAQGIRMGKWHWNFLAFGNSQVRENGAFFFCQPEGAHDNSAVTCDSIRQWMGNFSHISVVAKLAARLGQCFSTTRLLTCISSPKIVKIADVERNQFCFTDGVGKISPVLGLLVSDAWGLPSAPSAFQFRMGGCKGVLVTWPEVKGTEVHIRPSQEKFPAEYNGLEIIRCSQFACAALNRQTILILSCLGVPDDVFTGMMQEQLASYDTAMTDKNKAVELLSLYVDENMTTTTIARMVKNGFMESNDPFFRTVLQLWRSWSIKALKEKARLIVDNGAFVLGGVDETGTLRGYSEMTAGRKEVSQDELPQIFLQVPDPKDRDAYKVVTGVCIVGRNPSLHPGDIRVVEAVDVPELRHIKNVVLFPLTGDRDVPSMCSGGDLDGDDFFVIWDPALIPREWGHPPMNYTAPEPLRESQATIMSSIASFFVLFMKNDRLPLIAHAHLATADYEAEGPKHRKCLQLAELHSTAVDYVKTGIPARWDKNLDPRRFPHFMEKPKAKSYHSTSVLGKLYDMVDKKAFDCNENYRLPFDDRILKRYQLSNDKLRDARKIKSQYDIAMRRIMGQFEIRTEFEVWTTFVLSKPRVGTDYKVQEKVGREASGLKQQFRNLCVKAAGGRDIEILGPFIAAMYRVTWEELRIALYEARQPHVRPDGTVGLRRITARSMPLISFPWLFPDELGKIATGSDSEFHLINFGPRPPTADPQTKANRDQVGLLGDDGLVSMDYTRTSDGQIFHRGEVLQLFRHAEDDDDAEGADFNAGVVVSDLSGDSELEPEPEAGPTLESDQGSRPPDETVSINTDSADREEDLLFLEVVKEQKSGESSGSLAASLFGQTSGGVQGPSSPHPVEAGGDVPDLLTFSPVRETTKTGEDVDAGCYSSTCLSPVRSGAREQKQTTGVVQLSARRPGTITERVATPTSSSGSSQSHGEMSTPSRVISLPASEACSQDARFGSSGAPRPETPVLRGMNPIGQEVNASTLLTIGREDESSGSEVEYEEEIVEVEVETAMERAARFA